MSGATATAPAPARGEARVSAASIRALLRDRPAIPLAILLGILIVISEIVRPGTVDAGWASVIVRSAVPLAILAGAQTLTMLTGGIDLSVGAVASMSGFLVATLVGDMGFMPAILVASQRPPWPA